MKRDGDVEEELQFYEKWLDKDLCGNGYMIVLPCH